MNRLWMKFRIINLIVLLAALLDNVAIASYPRIVNGTPTQDNATTGALLINIGSDNVPYYFGTCSGVLVGCHTFLTAAHCVCNNPLNTQDKFSNCLERNPKDYRVYLQNGGIYGVSAYKINPDYELTVDGDIAVLSLTEDITGIPPSPINTFGTPPYDSIGRIVGFGITESLISSEIDIGLKRQGEVSTTNCVYGALSVTEPQHLCWKFTNPVGAVGEDSNTCSGDSGGPLFIEIDGMETVAGITSGGFSPSCLTPDLSFDSNIYENREFIKNTTFQDSFSKEIGKCRSTIRKFTAKYLKRIHKASQKCINAVNAGKKYENCPGLKTQNLRQKAQSKLSLAKIEKRCPDDVIGRAGFGGLCRSAKTSQDLKNCIIAAGDQISDDMLAVEFADDDPSGPINGKDLTKCQKVIAKKTGSFLLKGLKTSNRCESLEEKGKVEDCPDSKATKAVDKWRSKVDSGIRKACTDMHITTLDSNNPFGASCAGAGNLSDIVACQLDEHSNATDDLVKLASEDVVDVETAKCDAGSQVGDMNTLVIHKDQTNGNEIDTGYYLYQFEVTSGITELRITLNGVEFADALGQSPVDLDLYVKYGSQPALNGSNADLHSINYGVYEAVKAINPQTGTWYILVHDYFNQRKPFQLTVTLFSD